MNSDGSIVAIGANANNSISGHVRVYENQGGSWVQLGQDIDGEAANDQSGWSVSLSSDGSIVAIGAYGNADNGSFSGHVRVYENQGGSWVQLGQDIDGEAANDGSGISVSLSSDGSIVAIGAYRNTGSSIGSGHVRVYENQGGSWVQLGQDIDGEAANDQSGISVSLSSDGSIVAIGAAIQQSINAGNGNGSGYVRIYENQGGNWIQLGQNIDGEAANDQSGWSVSLNSDGSIVAIGALYNSGNAVISGHVRIYKNQGGSWVQLGQDIDGEAVGDRSGRSVSLSSDKSTVAIGAPLNDGNGSNSGHVRVYDLSAVLSTESFKQDYFTMYPNPVKNVLNIELRKGIELKKINIYNALGQFVNTTKKRKIKINNFKSGIYFLEVETNQGKSAKKIVVE